MGSDSNTIATKETLPILQLPILQLPFTSSITRLPFTEFIATFTISVTGSAATNFCIYPLPVLKLPFTNSIATLYQSCSYLTSVL